jgi:hypothetical protein
MRLAEIRGTLGALACHVLGQLPTNAGGKKHGAILVAFPWMNPPWAGLDIDRPQAPVDAFSIPDPGEK